MVSNDGSLRASEFAVTLNGDNPQAILKVLQEFATTVRKERKISLALDDDDDHNDDDLSDDDEMEATADAGADEPPAKKYKKSEEWKADTASYHVPFVGTAVARGERAEVVKGEWPTGLVKAYLQSSPLALELLNDDLAHDGQIHKGLIKKKKGKVSRAIGKAHQLALAELLTVAIPIHKLKEEYSLDDSGDREDMVVENNDFDAKFMQSFTKSHLPRLFDILNEETERGRGKAGAVGGCDMLTAPALRVLRHFSMISISNARLVARYLDESLMDGVLRVCLRPLHAAKEGASDGSSSPRTRSKLPRIEAILLATSLLEANDAAVNTYICTGGSKERKVKPGILFIALREGLAAPSNNQKADSRGNHDDKYNNAATDMLERLRVSMFNGSKTANARLLFNLLSRDPLQNLCRLSSHAPPLTKSKTYLQVLLARDSEDVELDTTLEDLCVEARRLLFPLLCDSAKSPFLPNFGADQVARSMIRLLESRNAGVELRRFLLYCTNENPTLVEELFGLMTMPDPKKNFAFISRSSFIALLFSKGPSPVTCLSSKFGERQMSIEDVLPTFLPIKLKGQFLAKSLRNGSHLVQLESFKIITIILNRFRSLRSEGVKKYKWDRQFIQTLTTATFQWLPDLQMLLSLRSRFDGNPGDRCGAILSDQLFRVIESFVTLLPSLVEKETFDWMKLLPGDADKFNQALPIVQSRVLKCLRAILQHCQRDTDHLLLSSKIIFEVMLSTRNRKIHSMCQEIITSLMTTALLPRVTNVNAADWIQGEIATWIDAVSHSTLPTFFKLLQEIMNDSWSQLAFLGKAWKKHHVPKNMNFSSLFAAAFSVVNDSSNSFASFVGQVAARRLASLRDPLPLAAVIIFANHETSCIATNEVLAPLVKHAEAIVGFLSTSLEERIFISTEFLKSYYANDSPCSAIPSLLSGKKSIETLKLQDETSLVDLSPMRLVSFLKVLNHSFIFAGDGKDGIVRYWQIIQKILPSILLCQLSTVGEREVSAILTDIYAIHKSKPNPNFEELEMLVLSCPNSKSNDFVKRRKSSRVDEVYKSRESMFSSISGRSELLGICVAKNNLPPNDKEKVQLSLISDGRNQFSELGLQFLTRCLRIEPGQFKEKFTLEDGALETMVNAWVWIGKEVKDDGDSPHRLIRGSLCAMLTHILKQKSVKAASLLMLVGKVPESLFLALCLDFSTEEKSTMLAEKEFLDTLLRIDPDRFVGPFLRCLHEMTPRLSSVWEAGYLDQSVEIFLEAIQSSPDLLNSLLAPLSTRVTKRFTKALSTLNKPFFDGIAPLARLLCTILEAENVTAFEVNTVARELIRTLSLISATHNIKSYDQGIRSICRLGICILGHLQDVDEESEKLSIELGFELFNFLMRALPKIVKKNSSSAQTEIPSDLILTWLIRLIQDNGKHDILFEGIEASVSQKACRTCLKHGVATGNEACKLSTLSLHFMALLMRTQMNTQNSGNSGIPEAKEVFSMITSHSKFAPLFTDTDHDEDDTKKTEAKETVLKLLITCNMVSTESIVISPSTWKLIFASFNAGLSDLDILIRQLVGICSDDSVPFMDDLQWKGYIMESQEQPTARKFDWFIDALDVTRIRTTISRFPISDKMDIEVPLGSIWTEKSSYKQNGDTSLDTDQVLRELFKLNRENSAIDTLRNDREPGDDERYSPAFVLPLVLKTIESGISPNNSISSDCFQTDRSRDDEETPQSALPWIFSKSSVASIQQLCEKGVVSLCLASLSSLCERVRCYAVSILGLILQACHTSHALDYSSWRDRPQLVLILNSVQRSFLFRKALDKDDAVVPRVTPIIATFLARAALVLPKPDDALYVSMNRYFLKNEADHGAFQDMKRLPAFMSLFCSSSEDSNQSRAERMWGLQMLCEGIVDASCYRLVTSCHAPELILSSFENVRLSQASDEAKGAEFCLLLDALTSMIEHGEYGAHVHLVRRCGLLSWMSALCSSRSLIAAFPTERSRISFCQLTNAVIEIVFCTPKLKSPEMIDEVCALIQPLVSLCLIRCQSGQLSSDVYRYSFMALSALSIGLRKMKEEGLSCPDILPLGVSLESTLDVLRITDGSMKALSLHTLCSLPISMTTNSQQETTQKLILLMLEQFDEISIKSEPTGLSLQMAKGSGQLISVLLKRIALLTEQCQIDVSSTSAMTKEISTKIFTLRCNSRVSEASTQDLWSKCLSF